MKIIENETLGCNLINLYSRLVLCEVFAAEAVAFSGICLVLIFKTWLTGFIAIFSIIIGLFIGVVWKPLTNGWINNLDIIGIEPVSEETNTFWNSVYAKDLVKHEKMVRYA